MSQHHCRVHETVHIFRNTALPPNMEEGKQLKGTCHFISMYLDVVKEEYLHVT
jgi:hypothetical protein